jgi:hypothetical protein
LRQEWGETNVREDSSAVVHQHVDT